MEIASKLSHSSLPLDEPGYTCTCAGNATCNDEAALVMRSFELKNDCFTTSFKAFKRKLNVPDMTQVNETRLKQVISHRLFNKKNNIIFRVILAKAKRLVTNVCFTHNRKDKRRKCVEQSAPEKSSLNDVKRAEDVEKWASAFTKIIEGMFLAAATII